jgi:primase-polymerase (primpol)-like protein
MMIAESSPTLQALSELQSLMQWCNFKKEVREGDDKPTKVPYHPSNYRASSSKSATWSSYEAVVRACRIANLFSGIGFFFNGQVYSGIDIDDCVDENGIIADWAWEIIRLLDSYTEFSTSGTGVHIVVKGLLQLRTLDKDGVEYIKGSKNNPPVGNVPQGKLEIYSERRFFVVTGNHVSGTPTTINERQDELLSILNTFFVEPKAEKEREFYKKSPRLPDNYQPADIPQNDNELWQIMFREKNNGRTWERLYYGDAGDYMGDDGRIDESRADAALAAKLVFYTQHDASRVERMLWQTGLVRDKWTSHPTYLRQLTIDNAMGTITDNYDPLYYKREAERLENKRFEEIRMNHQAKSADETEEEPTKEEPKLSSSDQVKLLLSLAIEKKNTEQVYALVDMIALLATQEQANIESAIKSNIKCLPGFSISGYKKCLKEAQDKQKQRDREERKKAYSHENDTPYFKEAGSMWMSIEPTDKKPDPEPVQISNFTGMIASDITTDDGAEKKRSYEIEADLHGRLYRIEVPVEELARCEWVDKQIGARARVTVGRQMKEHLAAAIKAVSEGTVIEKTQYAHTGWRKIDECMVYLHNFGCVSGVSGIGSDKINYTTHSFFSSEQAYRATPERENLSMSGVSGVSGVNIEASVRLTGSLCNYVFSDGREGIQQAIRASIAIVNITQDTITMPLYAALCRSVLGAANLGVHLAGQTGQGKSQLAALVQQHFGASMDADHLPGSWESTENALEMKLFQAKDAIFTADDFKPKGSKNTQSQLHGKADRVFRSMGNGSARARLDGNLNLRTERCPRCFLLSTGEDIPKGQSCQARMIVLVMTESVTKGDASKRLTLAQKDARDGMYAKSMAGYIEWLAPRIEAIQAQWPSLVEQERNNLSSEGHSRSGTNTANLILGMKCFLQYACEMDAITPQEAQTYLTRCINALVEVASEASRENQQMKPCEQWKRLLISAISGNRAHLVTADGDNPGPGYGWKKSERSYTNSEGYTVKDETYSGGGSQIGWIEGEDIYLESTSAYTAVVEEGSRSHDNITISRVMLDKDLVKDGMLASTDLQKSKPTIAIRKRLQGSQRYVLHIKKNILFPDDPISDSHHSHHSHHSGGHESSSEQGSDVSGENHTETPEWCDSPLTSETSPHTDSIPDEYRGLLVRYQKKVFSLPVNTLLWRASDNGYKNTMFDKNGHIARTKSLLRSGETPKVKGAVEAMQRTLGEYEEDRRGA